MSPPILTDSDIAESLSMSQAVQCMEEAFRQHAAGTLIAPGRIASDLEVGQLVFTVGASKAAEPIVGFRAYDLKQLHSPQRGELNAVFSAEDGSLKGLVIGPLLGAIRTGAIGGVAVKYLSRPDAKTLAMVGTGYQARTQLEAAMTVRDFESVKVYSRNVERRNEFANDMANKLDRDIRPADSAREAVSDADVVICTTTSSTPVVQADWLKPGVHINNVGPKFKESHELNVDVAARSARLVTDAPAQVSAYGDRFILHGTAFEEFVVDLAEIVAGPAGGRTAPDQITLFYSMGLAGTEVLLANELFQ